MGVKEFIDDVKEMIKTKDMTKVNEKYVHPAWEMTKEVSVKMKDLVVENTPKVIAATKSTVEKAKEIVRDAAKKAEKKSEGRDNETNGVRDNPVNRPNQDSHTSQSSPSQSSEKDPDKKDHIQNK